MSTPAREGETIEGSRTMRNRPYPVLKSEAFLLKKVIVVLFLGRSDGRASSRLRHGSGPGSCAAGPERLRSQIESRTHRF